MLKTEALNYINLNQNSISYFLFIVYNLTEIYMHKWNIMYYIWKTMFNCFWKFPVEKVAVLCRFLDIGAVTKNHLLKYALAHAFCCFLTSVEDVNPAVATRARLMLDTIKRPALQVTSDYVPLETLQKSSSLRNKSIFLQTSTWHTSSAFL